MLVFTKQCKANNDRKMTKKPSYNVTEFSDMYSSEQIHTHVIKF